VTQQAPQAASWQAIDLIWPLFKSVVFHSKSLRQLHSFKWVTNLHCSGGEFLVVGQCRFGEAAPSPLAASLFFSKQMRWVYPNPRFSYALHVISHYHLPSSAHPGDTIHNRIDGWGLPHSCALHFLARSLTNQTHLTSHIRQGAQQIHNSRHICTPRLWHLEGHADSIRQPHNQSPIWYFKSHYCTITLV
jgi:hypothetical protein